MRWLVCDYGGVLSLDQTDEDRAALVALGAVQAPPSAFWSGYWRHRPAYDRAELTVEEYWAAVLGTQPAADRLASLIEVDIGSWCHPNPDALAATVRAGDRGFRLAVLSNAPIEVARALDRVSWLEGFEPRFFSCDLHAIKPEPAIYRSVMATLGAPASEIVFFDDREDNVAAAAALGIEAHLFSAAPQLDAVEP